jgi:hypothetical protein
MVEYSFLFRIMNDSILFLVVDSYIREFIFQIVYCLVYFWRCVAVWCCIVDVYHERNRIKGERKGDRNPSLSEAATSASHY